MFAGERQQRVDDISETAILEIYERRAASCEVVPGSSCQGPTLIRCNEMILCLNIISYIRAVVFQK